jgi:hypothetical protein
MFIIILSWSIERPSHWRNLGPSVDPHHLFREACPTSPGKLTPLSPGKLARALARDKACPSLNTQATPGGPGGACVEAKLAPLPFQPAAFNFPVASSHAPLQDVLSPLLTRSRASYDHCYSYFSVIGAHTWM